MYKAKHALLSTAILSIVFLVVAYIVGTIRSITKAYGVNLIGNTYVSVNQDFSLEFLDETTVNKYTVEDYYTFNYRYSNGIYLINDYEMELEAVALNKGKDFYIVTTNTYLVLAN